MPNEIIKRDHCLFLFTALATGKQTGLLSEAHALALETEGAQMAFTFAKKYYRIVYEAYLRQASFCVLGIINLGLTAVAKNDPEAAARLIREKGAVGLFREGWTRVLKLLKLIRKTEGPELFDARRWERELAERLGAEPGKPWDGANEFFRMTRKYGMLVMSEKEKIHLR